MKTDAQNSGSVLQIDDGIFLVRLGLVIADYETLVISDTHFGYETEKKGMLLPAKNMELIMYEIEEICKSAKENNLKLSRIILNGDAKHSFGKPTKQEWRELTRFVEFLKKRFDDIVVIKGNHDVGIEKVCEKIGIKLKQREKIGKCEIFHGDVMPEMLSKDTEVLVLGHEHPSISFPERPGENYKCFLIGKLTRKARIGKKEHKKEYRAIFMPSIFALAPGNNVFRDGPVGQILPMTKVIKVYAVLDKIYYFGSLSSLEAAARR